MFIGEAPGICPVCTMVNRALGTPSTPGVYAPEINAPRRSLADARCDAQTRKGCSPLQLMASSNDYL